MKEFDNFLGAVTAKFDKCEDFVCRQGGDDKCRFALAFIRVITSRDYISETFLKPLLRKDISSFDGNFNNILECPNFLPAVNPDIASDMISKGEVLVIIENQNGFYSILANAQFSPSRSIEEPDSDVTVRGPKAGFVEDAEKNSALLRKYIRTPNLKFESFILGSVSSTKVVVAYVENRADKKTVEEIKKRISDLKADVITDSTHVSMLLTGRKIKILPDCGSSEKVDKVASKLMSGRIGIIVDGSPFVLTVPYLFIEGLQSAEDYLHTPFYATFIRFLRLFALISAIFAPAILCAVVNYNSHLIPMEFYGIIEEARADIPVSFFWEIMAVLFLFEVLREVGVRMPRTVGDAVGIVGSVILGNTAVEAGIVSSIGVITVAFSAVCAFITPAFMYAIVLERFLALVIGELFGVIGLVIYALVLITGLIVKRSFGYHYLWPLIPFNREGIQDTVFAWPQKTLGRKEQLKK